MYKGFIILFVVCLSLNSCKQNNKYNNTKNLETLCIRDTIIDIENKVTYDIKEKDNLCLMRILLNGKSKINPDTFYYDKNDCRMIPKLLYAKTGKLFLISGNGFNYRKIHKYEYSNNEINKTETQFDLVEPDSEYNYYPFFTNDTLFVLREDTLKNCTIIPIRRMLSKKNIKSIILIKNELILLHSGKKIKVQL